MVGEASFGQLLRKHRLAAGFSQETLAEVSRTSAAAVGALERGERRAPYRATVALLAKALELSAGELAELEAAADRARGRRNAGSQQKPRHNLPLKLSSFIDRVAETEDIKALLREHRLVTLTGSGGVGKTRTAMEIARGLLDEGWHEVRFVDLAPVRDSAFVAGTIASIVGPALARIVDPLPTVPRYRSMLLLLDNCEHVIDGAAAAAANIIHGNPGISILATSRERLAIDGERVYRLPSLDGAGALQLFADRAAASDARFVLTGEGMRAGTEICRRLGGIPLAIELAATRIPTLGLEALNARLEQQMAIAGRRDLPERQRTTLATIAWSYHLLNANEQALLRRLAIFRAGATLRTAETVCATGLLAQESIAELISRLVDKSLVEAETSGPPRFTMLDSVRAFAADRLKTSEEYFAVARAHARWLAGVSDRANEQFSTVIRNDWLLQYAPLLDDARAALDWVLASQDPDDAVLGGRIAGGLRGLWLVTNRRGELRRWSEGVLSRVDERRYPRVAANLLCAVIQSTEGAAMQAAIDRAVELFGKIGDTHGMIIVHMQTAWQARVDGDLRRAEDAIARAFALAEETQEAVMVIHLLDVRSTIHIAAGRIAEARADLNERARRLEMYPGADGRENAHKEAMLALLDARPVRAAEHLEDAVEYCIEHSRSPLEPLIDLASVQLQLGDFVAAETVARQALDLVRLDNNDLARWALEVVASIAAAYGQGVAAARLLGFAEVSSVQPGREDAVFARTSRERLIETLHAQLPADAIAMYRKEGAMMDGIDAIDLAQSVWSVFRTP